MARTDLFSGIMTCAILTGLFGFLILCQKNFPLVQSWSGNQVGCLVLGILALVPLKNQVIHTYHMKRPQSKRLLTEEDFAEMKRCIVDQTLYFCFIVSIAFTEGVYRSV